MLVEHPLLGLYFIGGDRPERCQREHFEAHSLRYSHAAGMGPFDWASGEHTVRDRSESRKGLITVSFLSCVFLLALR